MRVFVCLIIIYINECIDNINKGIHYIENMVCCGGFLGSCSRRQWKITKSVVWWAPFRHSVLHCHRISQAMFEYREIPSIVWWFALDLSGNSVRFGGIVISGHLGNPLTSRRKNECWKRKKESRTPTIKIYHARMILVSQCIAVYRSVSQCITRSWHFMVFHGFGISCSIGVLLVFFMSILWNSLFTLLSCEVSVGIGWVGSCFVLLPILQNVLSLIWSLPYWGRNIVPCSTC